MSGNISYQTKEKLTGQCWLEWLDMGHSTLVGVSQMVWQNTVEQTENRELLAKVLDQELVPESVWQHSLTWTGAVLLSLSIEQSLKALAIRRTADKSCLRTHDLVKLWLALAGEDQNGIERRRKRLKQHARTTKLGGGDLDNVESTLKHHQSTFTQARYYKEARDGADRIALSANIDLWHAALAAFAYARELAPQHELGTGRTLRAHSQPTRTPGV